MFNKYFFCGALLLVLAFSSSNNGSPIESENKNEERNNGVIPYDTLSSCSSDKDCAKQSRFKKCRYYNRIGYKCAATDEDMGFNIRLPCKTNANCAAHLTFKFCRNWAHFGYYCSL